MATEPAPADAGDDQMLVREVEAAIRSLTLVEGCAVEDLRRVLDDLREDAPSDGAGSPLPPMHSGALATLR